MVVLAENEQLLTTIATKNGEGRWQIKIQYDLELYIIELERLGSGKTLLHFGTYWNASNKCCKVFGKLLNELFLVLACQIPELLSAVSEEYIHQLSRDNAELIMNLKYSLQEAPLR